MSDQSESKYLAGEVVWVKLGSCWWPGEVVGEDNLPSDLPSFRKPPIAIVKFFQEDSYEYVKNPNSISKYDCSRKTEFIKKGLDTARNKQGSNMEKFPEDIIRAEIATGGDQDILCRDEFQEQKKESYAGLFGTIGKKTPASAKKGKGQNASDGFTSNRKNLPGKSDYKVYILLQDSKTASNPIETNSTPSTSSSNLGQSESISPTVTEKPISNLSPSNNMNGGYSCHACPFTTSRLNVMILHNKTHSSTFIPYTPSPVRKKTEKKSPKTTPKSIKNPKASKEKTKGSVLKKSPQKRVANEQSDNIESKKPKTDDEIKSSLLADWDDGDEESNDESTAMLMTGSPDIPIGSESPAVPTATEFPSAQVTREITDSKNNDNLHITEKQDFPNDSKYEFCEDEDWSLETDVGRKIPRVKNPTKRKDDTKRLSLDENEVAKEVAVLLSKTTVPELPIAPDLLNIEENFPEPSAVKSPDKVSKVSLTTNSVEKINIEVQHQKPTIFKTKTFFRSRHSRSQDAIGKYVAEQLNAAERMDNISEIEINGSEVVSSPEPRESPVEYVKTARLAPKIQLKKMKAELREKEKSSWEQSGQELPCLLTNEIKLDKLGSNSDVTKEIIDDRELSTQSVKSQDVLYPTQEIRPINKEADLIDKVHWKENNHACNIMDNGDDPNHKTKESINLNDNENPATNPEQISDIVIHKIVDSTSPVTFLDIPEKPNNYQQAVEPYMNESTASAVDALLSVSREKDRVTKIISNDPPEDLFEDDMRDNDDVNNVSDLTVDKENVMISEPEMIKYDETQTESDELKTLTKEKIAIATNSNDNMLCVNTEGIITQNVCTMGPSESDLQIAEALINLPSTAIQNTKICSSKSQDEIEIESQPPCSNSHPKPEMANAPKVSIDPDRNIVFESKCSYFNDVQKSSETSLELSEEHINARFETELEKSENLNAAQSLVQMSESVEHGLNIIDDLPGNIPKNHSFASTTCVTKISNNNEAAEDHKLLLLPEQPMNITVNNDLSNGKLIKIEKTSSKLLKILEEPCMSKAHMNKSTINKQIILPVNDKVLNFDVGKSSVKGKNVVPKQKIIIRRTIPNKTLINNVNEVTTPDKIILSRNNKSQDGSSIQTYTIQTTTDKPTDANTIIIQQKLKKLTKAPPKLQKMKHQASLIIPISETRSVVDKPVSEDAVFDINSMPIVLSDDILTPENIEKMPIVMSDGNIVNNNQPQSQNIIKPKQNIEKEMVLVSAKSVKSEVKPLIKTEFKSNKSDMKTLLINPATESNKISTPNILSKSTKLRGSKPMLVIDKTTGKQKFIMTKSEPISTEVNQASTNKKDVNQTVQIKEINQVPKIKENSQISSKVQPSSQTANKTEKFIILPTSASPRIGRTQKIVIDPQTGKAHVLLAKGQEMPLNISDNKPISAKLIPTQNDVSNPGNTVMIITNSQGAQSRIVLTPEHEKILFPNKQQPNMPQLKAVTQRITNTGKTVVTTVPSIKPQSKIVPKQKSAIITSKGQLIVGGCVTATTTQSTISMPEIRPALKRVTTTEPKKLIQTIQKNASEPLIFLQQKSGAVMQLTAAQFEHLQRTGEIVLKPPVATPPNKIIVQKSITVSTSESIVSNTPKQKVRRPAPTQEVVSSAKKAKPEIVISPSPPVIPAMPALTSFSNTLNSVPSVINTISVGTTSTYPELDNFEELLPSTAIVRQPQLPPPEPVPVPTLAPPEPVIAPAPSTLSDGQILAVPGEHFGGPPGSFYLCMEENGTLTPIDNSPLVLQNDQLVPMTDHFPVLATPPERRDILEAALANSDVFHADSPRDEAPDFRDLNANVSVHCRVSETSTTLNQPIMTPVEVPTKVDGEPTLPTNLEDGLAVIGVTPQTVPTSLELPITVTDPRIAPKMTDPLSNNNYGPPLITSPSTFITNEEPELSVGPISMPLLTDEEPVGKSMPLLTDDVITEKTASSIESTVGSPSSLDVRESETEDGSQWTRRLLTPGSDTSETSAEIPFQSAIQLTGNDMSRNG